MKTLVIGMPDTLPPELAENPDVIVVDPSTLPEELLGMLNEASGGALLEEEGGEGALSEWAAEEEKEPEHGGQGEGDNEEEDGEDKPGGEGYGADDEEKDPLGGEGDDEDEDPSKKPPMGGQRGGRTGSGKRGFGISISARGSAIPALSQWARSLGRG